MPGLFASLHSEYYGEDNYYTRKGGVVCSEILLPVHAPPEYADREILWNAVEKVGRGKNVQLAYSFDIALPFYCLMNNAISGRGIENVSDERCWKRDNQRGI